MVIYLIVFCLQCIQMLIFICILTILCLEGISIRRLAEGNGDYDEIEEPLIDQGLEEEEIAQVTTQKPKKIESDETCSICLSEFITTKDVTQFPTCKHMFHDDCIKGWLPRSHR